MKTIHPSVIEATKAAIREDVAALERIKSLMFIIRTEPGAYPGRGDDYHAALRVSTLLKQRIKEGEIQIHEAYDDIERQCGLKA